MAYNNLNTDELRKRLDELLSMGVMNMPQEHNPELQELLIMQEYIIDWEYGEILIHQDNFQDYAEDFATSVGIFPDIKELKQDYTEFTYLGEIYYAR